MIIKWKKRPKNIGKILKKNAEKFDLAEIMFRINAYNIFGYFIKMSVIRREDFCERKILYYNRDSIYVAKTSYR